MMERWKPSRPESTVVAETFRRFNRISNRGCIPRNVTDAPLYYGACDSVLFGISTDLHDPDIIPFVTDSLKLWNKKGRAVLMSHDSHYLQSPDAVITETSPVVDCDITTAEKLVTDAGGIVVRLAGLFGGSNRKQRKDDRGPSPWFKKEQVKLHANDTISIIHYEDAVDVLIAALEGGKPGSVYLASCDSLTAYEAYDIMHQSYKWNNKKQPSFVGEKRTLFSKQDNSWTRKQLHVRPQLDFAKYMSELMW